MGFKLQVAVFYLLYLLRGVQLLLNLCVDWRLRLRFCHCDGVLGEVDRVDIEHNAARLSGLIGVEPVSIEALLLELQRSGGAGDQRLMRLLRRHNVCAGTAVVKVRLSCER